MRNIIKIIVLLFVVNLNADQYDTFIVRTKGIIRISFNSKVNINAVSVKIVNNELHIIENGSKIKVIESINFTSVSVLKKSNELGYIELQINSNQ